jgi:DNA repair protein RadC
MTLREVRAKAKIYGVETLEADELLELLIGKKIANSMVKELVRESQTIYQIRQGLNLSAAKAAVVAAAMELGKRAAKPLLLDSEIVDSPAKSAEALFSILGFSNVERFAILALNVKNQLMGVEEITVGSKTETLAPPVEIFRRALAKGGTKIIVGHNHPSGCLEPSPGDLELTRRLLAGGDLMSIPVLDHLILGNGDWVSLRQTTDLWHHC